MTRFLSNASALLLRSLLLTILIAGPILAAAAGTGNGIEVHTPSIWGHGRPAFEVFINKPIHNAPAGTYQKNAVPLEYRAEWGVCGNISPGAVFVMGRFAENGGKLSTLNNVGTIWKVVHTRKLGAASVPCSGAHSACNAISATVTDTLDLSSLSADACNTTLQIVGWKWALPHSPNQNLNDLISLSNPLFYSPYASRGIPKGTSYAHAVNLWLNFACPAAPPPSSSSSSSTSSSSVSTSSSSSSSSSVSTSSSSSSAPVPGCIDIVKETFAPNNTAITPVAQFTFHLEDGRTVKNDSNGHARIDNVSVGQHTVSEDVPSGWTQLSTTPVGGVLNVPAGPSCVTVVFKNKQVLAQPAIDVSIAKSGPPAIHRGDTVRYTVTVKNEGTAVVNNVSITDPVPANTTFNQSLSDSPCALQGGNVVCSGITLAPGQSQQFMIAFTVSSSLACEGVSILNTATVSAPGDSVSANNQSSAGEVAVTCPGGPIAPTFGCIDIRKETFDPSGAPILPIAQFKFHLEDGRVTYNKSDGIARFENVSVGSHTVSEEMHSSWTLLSTTPVGGVIEVPEGPTCVTVLFKNKQILPPFTAIARDQRDAGMSIQPFSAPFAPTAATTTTASTSTTTSASPSASVAPVSGETLPILPVLPGRNLNFWQSFYGRK